jgi:hypothetical protein
MEMFEETDMLIIRLWKQKDKSGNSFLSGEDGSVIFKANTSKKGNEDPDYYLIFTMEEKKDGAWL